MASSRKPASEKKTKESDKKRPSKSNKKRNKDHKTKTSNGVEARTVAASSSSDSECNAENGFEINRNRSSNGKREQEERDPSAYRFPMERVRRIIRSEDTEMRITNEAVFIVNKATEKFLERFCGEAYACCLEDRKKSLSYKHLSSAVSKRKRYDFLSDFVPVKVKAEDALAEIKQMGSEAA